MFVPQITILMKQDRQKIDVIVFNGFSDSYRIKKE